jgi:sulfate/thiosulfate transport system substrate-binding protein
MRSGEVRCAVRLRAVAASCALLAGSACERAPAPAAAAAPAPVSSVAPARPPVALRFGAFSAAREAFGTRLLPQFTREQRWQRAQRVAFDTLFTGSELLVDAVGSTFAADVAVFAHTHDVDALVEQGLVAPSWREQPHGGIVCRSLVVLAVRAGNPKRIRDWADLVRPDVAIVCADPATSGGAVWNACALYGAALRGQAGVPANDAAAAAAFVQRVQRNVVARAATSGDAYALFRGGTGDVAITYESEVALGWLFGNDAERVIPASTLLVESAAVVVERNAVQHGARAAAAELCAFLWSPAAQRELARCGLRPVDPEVFAAHRARFPAPVDLWTIDFLGGWQRAVDDVLPLVAAPAAVPPGK